MGTLRLDGAIVRVTKDMILNPPYLKAFWDAIRKDKSKMARDHVIKLPKGIYFLGDSALGSSLYIRHCYPQLLEICCCYIHETKSLSQTIMGNPGIGKTFFGLFLVCYIARKDATVVYESESAKRRYLFTGGVTIIGSIQHFDDILKLPTTYYVVDGSQPAFVQAKTIFLTAPKRSTKNEFFLLVSELCYLPVWSKEEILMCKELLYPKIHPNLVLDPYERWGGIPRHFLSFTRTKTQEMAFKRVLGRVTFDWFESVYGKLCDSEKQNIMSALLVHFRVNNNTFQLEGVMFASHYVLDEVYVRLYKQDSKKLTEYLAMSNVVGPFGELCRQLQQAHTKALTTPSLVRNSCSIQTINGP